MGSTSDLVRLVDATRSDDRGLSGWGTENPGYSDRDFYTGCTDGKGHSERTQVRVAPEVLTAIGNMVSQRAIPAYRSVQDFIRDAMVHRLHQVYELGLGDSEEVQRLRNVMIRKARVEQRALEAEARRDLIAGAEANLRGALADGDLVELKEMLVEYAEMVDGLRDPWKSRLQEIVDKYRRSAKSLE